MKTIFTIFLPAAILVLIGCKSNNKNESATTDQSAVVSKITKDWNDAHNSKDVAILASLYNQSIEYYGKEIDKNDCIDKKLAEFKKHKDYYQQIDGEIQCEKISESEYKCSFLKRVTINHKTKNYPSFLVISKSENEWKIIEENDRATDRSSSKSTDNKVDYTSDIDRATDNSSDRSASNGSVKIGAQIWMTNNLNVSSFRSGDIIPQAYSMEEWLSAGYEERPVWCYYEFKNENGYKYGKLYNWYAVNDLRGLAPSGWHIASDVEWNSLSNYFGGDEQAGYALKAINDWYNDGNGNNESGFYGLPGGSLHDGRFSSITKGSSWWTSSNKNEREAFSRHLHFKDEVVHKTYYNMASGFSVRCVKN